MSTYSDLKCWEIMNCNNLDCLARKEPEKPCWELAKREGDYRDISNTCRDCVVYLLHNETSALSMQELQKIIELKGLSDKTRGNNRACALKKISGN